MSSSIRIARSLQVHAALTSMLLTLSASAHSCDKWDITGTWHIQQANGYAVTLELTARNGHYSGYAPPEHHRQAAVSDVVLNGDSLSMTLLWGPDDTNATDATGVYTGKIGPNGRISGATYDRDHPNNATTWSRAEPLKCLDSALPKPVHRLGKIGSSTTLQNPSVSDAAGMRVRPLAAADANDIASSESTSSVLASGATVSDSAKLCITGYVWREARPSDRVCVTPESRTRVSRENTSFLSRVDRGGAQGLATCKSGFVWREAFEGDLVCVTPEVRDQVREENQLAATRVNAK